MDEAASSSPPSPSPNPFFDGDKILGCIYLMAAVFVLSSNVILQIERKQHPPLSLPQPPLSLPQLPPSLPQPFFLPANKLLALRDSLSPSEASKSSIFSIFSWLVGIGSATTSAESSLRRNSQLNLEVWKPLRYVL